MSAPLRLAMWVWYRGDLFRGFQRQPEGPTVQEALLTALNAEGVRGLVPSSRTDRGVHARMQVVSLKSPREPEALRVAVQGRLAEGLGIVSIERAGPSFHAQFSCLAREYRYRLLLAPGAPHPWTPFAWTPADHPRLLGSPRVAPERLQELLSRYVGTHDFVAFHEKSSVRKPRTLHSVTLHEREGGLFEIRFRGSGFGRYQIRYLVGSAVAVAAGVLDESAWADALASGSALDGIKAPGSGLVLWNVEYAEGNDPFSPSLRASAPFLPDAPPYV